jgi:hypothetical protein
MRSQPFEFNEKEVILYPGLFTWRKIKYADVVSVTPVNLLQMIARSADFSKKPLVSLSLGITWRCLLLESRWVVYGIMLNKRDDFMKELNEKIAAARGEKGQAELSQHSARLGAAERRW